MDLFLYIVAITIAFIFGWTMSVIQKNEAGTAYVCFHNGVYGVVRADDYEKALQEHWEAVAIDARHQPDITGPIISIPNTYHFCDAFEAQSALGSLGGLFNLKFFLQGLKVEYRKFYVLSISNLGPSFAMASEEQIEKCINGDMFKKAYGYIHGVDIKKEYPRKGVTLGEHFQYFTVDRRIVKYAPGAKRTTAPLAVVNRETVTQ